VSDLTGPMPVTTSDVPEDQSSLLSDVVAVEPAAAPRVTDLTSMMDIEIVPTRVTTAFTTDVALQISETFHS
jgi:hypothetical protein